MPGAGWEQDRDTAGSSHIKKTLSVFTKKPSQQSHSGTQRSKRKTPREITHLGTNTTSKGSAQVTPKDTRNSLGGCMSRKLKCRNRIHLSLPQGTTGPGHKQSHRDYLSSAAQIGDKPQTPQQCGCSGRCDESWTQPMEPILP